jgi:hypothetical protein
MVGAAIKNSNKDEAEKYINKLMKIYDKQVNALVANGGGNASPAKSLGVDLSNLIKDFETKFKKADNFYKKLNEVNKKLEKNNNDQ